MRPAQQRGEREEKRQNSVTFGSEKDTRSFYNIESWWTTDLLHITAVAMFFHGITHKSSDSLFSFTLWHNCRNKYKFLPQQFIALSYHPPHCIVIK